MGIKKILVKEYYLGPIHNDLSYIVDQYNVCDSDVTLV